MRRMVSSSSVLSLAVAAGALALAACSDTATAPSSVRPAGAPSLTVGPTANVGAVHVTFASSAATQFCSASTLIHTYTVPGSAGPIAGCGTAFDLTTPLNTYNPGWSAPIASSVWIGPTANSSDYRPTPGSYFFQTTFTVDAGVTSPVLNDTLLSDNAVAVYLNGHQLGAQVISDCPQPKVACNWQTNFKFIVSDNTASDFNIGGTNTITVLLVDTPNDGTAANGYTCGSQFQPNGEAGFSGVFNVPTSPNHVVAGWTQNAATSCENPTGLDFHGTVSWVVPVSTIWCSPGFWKNNGLDLWVPLQGLLYNASGPYPNDPQTFVGFDFGKKVGSQNPTLLEVISNPSIYGGPATNNVASFISFHLFGTPESANPTENCPDVLPLPN
jgi:hypothetical protein